MEKVVGVLTLTLPVGEVPDGHVSRHVAGRLTAAQGRGLKRLTAALKGANVELVSGRRVEDGAAAVRWLLEQYELTVEGKGEG